jgi:hypothetical protein
VTWTYLGNGSDRDTVRELVGDTDNTDPLATDEQIAKYLTGGLLAQGNLYLSAAMVASEIVTKFARSAQSLSAGGTSVNFGDRVSAYTKLAASLRARSSRLGGSSVFAGGISQAAKDVQTANTDNVVPAFTRRQGDGYRDANQQPVPDEPRTAHGKRARSSPKPPPRWRPCSTSRARCRRRRST